MEQKAKISTIEKKFLISVIVAPIIPIVLFAMYLVFQNTLVLEQDYTMYGVVILVVVEFISVVFALLQRKRMIENLKQQGRFVHAQVTKITRRIQQNLTKYIIECRATHPIFGKPMIFLSEVLSKDPQGKVKIGSEISVFYDMNDPYYYWVDTSSLK